jgi:phospholipid/cholesterol/gamma-HCH transport system substrate-binding protein
MKRAAHRWPLLLIVTLALGWLVVWINATGALNFAKTYYTFRAASLSAGSLATGASVTIAGIRVGQVTGIDPHGNGTLLDLEILGKYGPIPTDSEFAVRTRTIVGENYLALYPGHSHTMLPAGGTLPPSQQQETVDVDQILSTLQGNTRRRAQQLIQSVGSALQGRGQSLNDFLQSASATIENSAPLTAVLAHDHTQAVDLIDQLGQVAATIGERGTQIQTLASSADQTFHALATQDQQLGATLEHLPSTLTQIRDTTHILNTITSTATPVLFNLADAINEVDPAVHALAPAATRGTGLLHQVALTAPPLQTTLARLRTLAPAATTTLPSTHQLLCQINPALQYLDPYARELSTVIQDMGSATNFYDANAHAARLYATVGADTLQYLSPQAASAMHTLSSGVIGLHYALGYNPLPKPGDAAENATASTSAGYQTVQAPYPDVKAAC